VDCQCLAKSLVDDRNCDFTSWSKGCHARQAESSKGFGKRTGTFNSLTVFSTAVYCDVASGESYTLYDEDRASEPCQIDARCYGWFKVVYVFDISQTDGTPLPELPTKSGERGQDMLDRLLRFTESRGITVRFVERCKLNGAAGTSKGTEIEIRTSETDVTTQAATLAHEIAHSLLHWTADGHKITSRDGKEIDKQQRELEAEATAYTVCSYFGIQSPSDFYLAAYK
jgi:antirestriction protein ArdC